MAIELNQLDGGKVSREKRPGMYADGGGLYLQITNENSKSWIFRYKWGDNPKRPGKPKTYWIGLGSVKAFGLAEARERARRQRQLLADGLNPKEVREKERKAAELEAAKAMTFEECAAAYIEAHTPGWRNPKHAAQWTATLKTYAYPVMGSFGVQAIDTALVLKVLQPIWTKKSETASRVRGRIEAVLDYATASGFRTGDNPARWNGLLSELLPRKTKVRKVRHMPALPYAELPEFIASLRQQEGTSATALEFTILCASRTGESVGCRWDEIDFADKVWTVPAERMKADRAHRVPLSDRALELMESMRGKDKVYVFPGDRPSQPLSNMAMLMLLRRMGHADITVHGFRSTFKDWCRERSNFPNEISEAALAHVIGDKTEAAYVRGDALAKRRQLMAAWARYCASPSTTRGEVVAIGRKR